MGIGKATGRIAAIGFCVGALQAGAQAPNTLSSLEESQGFTLMFDGTREGFNSYFVDYVQDVPDQELMDERWTLDSANAAMASGGTASDIRSRITYKDFDFRLEFRSQGDAGVFYRFNIDNQYPWQSGVEMPIDDDAGFCKDCTGGVLALFEPTVPVYHDFASGEWNTLRVVVIGDSVEHWLNGSQVLGYRYHSEDFWARYDAGKWAGSQTLTQKVPGDRTGGAIAEGYVGFQGLAGAQWLLRTLRINTVSPHFGDPDAPTAVHPVRRTTGHPASRAGLRRESRQGRILAIPASSAPTTVDGRKALPSNEGGRIP